MADYIPSREPAKILWLWNLMVWLGSNGPSHGFTVDEVCELYFTVMQAKLAMDNNVSKQAAARGAVACKNDKLGAALEYARDLAQRIQLDPNTTDRDRAAAGLTMRDGEPSKSGEDDVLRITPPAIELDFSIRQQITVHWGPNPQDERHNGRPHGIMGCEIQYHRGGLPAQESEWAFLENDTDSPLVHTVHENQPTTFAYRVRYIGKDLKHGPFGNPAECTVSV